MSLSYPKPIVQIAIVMLLMFCNSGPLRAQGCFDESTEAELLSYFGEIKKWENSNDENSNDSLLVANNKFMNMLIAYQQESITMKDDLNRFLYQGMEYSATKDLSMALYSWELYTAQNMHKRCAVLFYQSESGIKSIPYTEGFAPYSIHELIAKNGRKLYLMNFDNEFTQKGRFKRVMAIALEARFGPPLPTPAFIFKVGNNDSSFLVEYNYDIPSYEIQLYTPDILVSNKNKKIQVPVVDRNGVWNKLYNTYVFDGINFIPESPKKK
jgi:hypothetical protein